MKQTKIQGSISTSAACLDSKPGRRIRSIGVFWGLLFASPLFLAGLTQIPAVLTALTADRFVWFYFFKPLVMILAAITIFVLGQLWARSGNPMRFWKFLARCLINGALIWGIFIQVVVCFNWGLEQDASVRSMDLGLHLGWRTFISSLFSSIIYQTLLGAIIRWRIRRVIQRPA